MSKEGGLRVWWIPQIPMRPFYYLASSVKEAVVLCDCLARYDIFQYENSIKSDYSNAGGLQVFENGEWSDWYDEETGDDIHEYIKWRR